MRILYCNKYNFAFSGTEAYLFDVMQLVRAGGHQAALFAMADPRGTKTEYDHHFVPHVDFKRPQGALRSARLAMNAIYSTEARRRLRGMIRAFRPDVAHVRNIYHHLSPSILWELRAQSVPVIYHLNDFKLICPSYNLLNEGAACERCREGQFWHVVQRHCYSGSTAARLVLAAEAYFHKWIGTYRHCVDLFLAPSHFVKQKLVQAGWPEDRIAVLPHFQRAANDPPQPPEENAPILYFGRLSPEKGLMDLLHAMRPLPGVLLQIAGDGPQRAALESLAQQLNLHNVEFLGHVTGTSLTRLIAHASFTVLPSHAYETLGKTILESYAAGRPVVASDLGSRRELVESGITGVLFPPGDAQALAAAIAHLHQNPAIAQRMGLAGWQRVRARHAPEEHLQSLLEIYDRVQVTKRVAVRQPPNERPLRVAFIGGRGVISRYGGIEAYYEEVGQRLVAAGHHLTVYCRTYFTPPGLCHNGMRLVRLPTIRSKHLDTLIHSLLSTVHVLFTDCDIVHYHALGPSLFSAIPRLLGKKTVVTVQGLDWQRKKWGPLASAVLRLGERASAKLPDATMVVSRVLQQYYRRRYGVTAFYVPNGAKILPPRNPCRILEWGLEPDGYVLFLGRFSPEKNCHLLIEAYERIDSPAKLVLAGGANYADDYAQELRRHASDRILLLDYVQGPDLEELLTNAALFVLPSDLEGLSLALLEAMGAGVCALTSDIPENLELVAEAGFTFHRGDVADLERMLRLLLGEKTLRQAAGARAQQIIRESYLWEKVTPQIENVYRALLQIPAARLSSDRQEARDHRAA